MYLTDPQGNPSRWELREPALDDASKLLLKAADYIEANGWCQGDWFSRDGSSCLRGAIYRAAGYRALGDFLPVEIARPALRRIDAALNGRSMAWNDTKGRTKEEVVAKLRSVALGG